MATLKKKGKLLGKAIRKATGLKLPVAMRFGKLLIRGRRFDIPVEYRKVDYCGDVCKCVRAEYVIGPKGKFDYKGVW